MRTLEILLAGRASEGDESDHAARIAPAFPRGRPRLRVGLTFESVFALPTVADASSTLAIFAVLLLLILPALGSAAPVPKELKKQPGLQGTWEVVSMHSQGQDIEMYRGARWRIGKDRIEIEYPEGIRVQNPSVVNVINAVDERASPAALDYTNYQGTDRKAAFAVDGDKLILSIPIQTPDRPKGLEADATNLFYTFKRIRE